MSIKKRCDWAKSKLDIEYHDREWGVPLHNDNKLFELLTLESAQAGLNWSLILQRREAYRQAYQGFDPAKIAHYQDVNIEELLANTGLIRHRLKITASIKNAGAFLNIQHEFGSFSTYLWQLVNQHSIINHWQRLEQVPSQTDLSIRLSKDLKKRGFNFVGPTICYSLMQAAGLVNDHLTSCFRYHQINYP